MDGPTEQYASVRRRNREVTDEQWIKTMLHEKLYAAIAIEENHQPQLNISLFIYDEPSDCIFFHTAGYGKTKEIIQKNPKVCLSVFEMGRMLPATRAVDFSTEYSSVVVFGKAEIVESTIEATDILTRFFKKYSPQFRLGVEVQAFDADDVRRATVYKISIEHWTGKRNIEPDSYSGAYRFAVRT
jgi:hypothetical protein